LKVSYRETRGLVLVDELQYTKALASILRKVISLFRKQLIMDQAEVAHSRLKFKHNIQHMSNTALTQYTQPDLITITDDLIEFKVDDTNFDMMNKESVLLGL